MLRHVLTIVAVAFLLAALPSVAAAGQTKASAPTVAKAAAPAVTVNINTASATDLEELPGIGAKTAARILEYRQKNGPFKKVEEILESSRSCPYLLNISRLSAHRSVSGNR